jgi:hypothetical protein
VVMCVSLEYPSTVNFSWFYPNIIQRLAPGLVPFERRNPFDETGEGFVEQLGAVIGTVAQHLILQQRC